MTIRERILERAERLGVAPSGSGWLVHLVWAVIDLDESGLEEKDREIGALIWPEYTPHTISWNLGRLIVEDSDPKAIAFCAALAEFMGTDHCQNAYLHGS